MRDDKKQIGVLCIQGSFAEHLQMCEKLDLNPVSVRDISSLASVSHLIIPGGESTTIRKLLQISGLWEVLQQRVLDQSLCVFGTCAGAILCADLGLDVSVMRNGFGAQQASMVTTLSSSVFPELNSAFIRAPRFIDLDPSVAVLATFDDEPVLVRQGNILAASFHPELVDEFRVYEYFMDF